jgi:fatty-acyl-CoA synthase
MPDLHARTLIDALEAAANDGRAGLVFHLQDGAHPVPASQILAFAPAAAEHLASRGVQPGDRVGVLGFDRPEWVKWAFAVWFAGGALVPMPYPIRIRDTAVFAEQIKSLLGAAGCRLVVTEPRFVDVLPEGVGVSWDQPVALSTTIGKGWNPTPDDPAVIQFTSGSTAAPKGAILTHRAILAAVENLGRHIGLGDDGAPGIGWLPFFHDNGLFGHLIAPVVRGVESHILPPERFAKSPAAWFRLMGDVGASITSGPPSAWAVAMRAACRHPDGIDMSTLRVGMLSAETIDPVVVDQLVQGGRQFGLRPGSLVGAYGMAEATLGVTIGRPGAGVAIDHVDQEKIATSGVAMPSESGRVKRVSSCGVPLPGVRLRIDGPTGPVRDRVIGEIRVQAPSLMAGYAGIGAPDPIEDGWLRTGDLGYTIDGELFVTGRIKDVVIVMGRNYAAEDIEWAAGRAAGVRAGRCVAFAPPGGSADGRVVVAVEPAGGGTIDGLPVRVRQAVTNAVGITPAEVLVLPRGAIPLTTSGKLRRAAVRDAYARRNLVPTAAGSEGTL